MDRGAWQATIHRVIAKRRTQLKRLSMHIYIYMCVCVYAYIIYKFYTYYILQNKEEKANERGENLFFTQREKEFDSKTLARK